MQFAEHLSWVLGDGQEDKLMQRKRYYIFYMFLSMAFLIIGFASSSYVAEDDCFAIEIKEEILVEKGEVKNNPLFYDETFLVVQADLALRELLISSFSDFLHADLYSVSLPLHFPPPNIG